MILRVSKEAYQKQGPDSMILTDFKNFEVVYQNKTPNLMKTSTKCLRFLQFLGFLMNSRNWNTSDHPEINQYFLAMVSVTLRTL